jgi:hypothetical protein
MSDWIQEDYYFDIELDLEAQEQLNDNIRAEMELHSYAAVFDEETAKKLGFNEDEYVKTLQINAEGRCPMCGAKLIHESGCVTCYSCGWSACE